MSARDLQIASLALANAKRGYVGSAATLATAEQAYRNLGGDPNTVQAASSTLITDYNAKTLPFFSFQALDPAAVGVVTGFTIAVDVPFETVVTALVATFGTTGASVKVGSTTQVSGTTPNNFTSPVVYTVTAADGSTQAYTVTVTVLPDPEA